jgi:hypothetical protein
MASSRWYPGVLRCCAGLSPGYTGELEQNARAPTLRKSRLRIEPRCKKTPQLRCPFPKPITEVQIPALETTYSVEKMMCEYFDMEYEQCSSIKFPALALRPDKYTGAASSSINWHDAWTAEQNQVHGSDRG